MQTKQSEFVEHKHFVNNDREKFFKSGTYLLYALFVVYCHANCTSSVLCITIESSLVDEPDKFATFEKWLLQNGTNLPKLELKVGHIIGPFVHFVL